MTFEEALPLLKKGQKIARAAMGPNQHVELRDGKARLVDGSTERTMVWFLPDLLADDWALIA